MKFFQFVCLDFQLTAEKIIERQRELNEDRSIYRTKKRKE